MIAICSKSRPENLVFDLLSKYLNLPPFYPPYISLAVDAQLACKSQNSRLLTEHTNLGEAHENRSRNACSSPAPILLSLSRWLSCIFDCIC